MITEEQLRELETLHDASAGGRGEHDNWLFDEDNYGQTGWGYGLVAPSGEHQCTGVHIVSDRDYYNVACHERERAVATGKWVAAIHNAAPGLIAEVRRLRSAVGENARRQRMYAVESGGNEPGLVQSVWAAPELAAAWLAKMRREERGTFWQQCVVTEYEVYGPEGL